jgi:prepilin-type N-terminal cleavage/methylation domain-containing protein
MHPRHGFTLVELSVALIIIGLVVGGIFVGRDLIKSATIRASLSQIERIKLATTTFKLRYNQLPGDMSPSRAEQLQFYALTGPYAGGLGMGNSDGSIEAYRAPCGGATDALTQVARPCGEMLVFWAHLSDAELIEGRYLPDDALDDTGTVTRDYSSEEAREFFPASKMAKNNLIAVYSDAQRQNWLAIRGVTGIASGSSWGGPLASGSHYAVTPIDAFQMDSKVDDGVASSGSVKAGGNIAFTGVGPPNICSLLPYPLRYNVDPGAGGDKDACEVHFKER